MIDTTKPDILSPDVVQLKQDLHTLLADLRWSMGDLLFEHHYGAIVVRAGFNHEFQYHPPTGETE